MGGSQRLESEFLLGCSFIEPILLSCCSSHVGRGVQPALGMGSHVCRFLSDERKDKPNLLPFGPMLVGMQFLTSGFLLPYLFTRTIETNSEVYKEDIDGEIQTLVAEWRPLGGFLGFVGTASVFWGLFARPEFGGFSERYASFGDLLSIDRVGSSFLVDLVIFAVFQSWFVDDDLKRRGVEVDGLPVLRNVAKFIPIFGLAAYLTVRPPLPSRKSND